MPLAYTAVVLCIKSNQIKSKEGKIGGACMG